MTRTLNVSRYNARNNARTRTVLSVVIAALVAFALVIAIGVFVLRPPRALLPAANVSPSAISPDADGQTDVTQITYSLSRNAQVSIAFISTTEPGKRYTFRTDQARVPGDYNVLFGGVVDGDPNRESNATGTIQSRLIPNGTYTWEIRAQADDGSIQTATGSLTVSGKDSMPPYLTNFEVSPRVFSPNQDGVDDRIKVNVTLAMPAKLTVYLQRDGVRHYVPERDEGRRPGEAGAHEFDYDAGVDNQVMPPPDGEYALIAEAEDAMGQRVRRETTITLSNGGLPQAEIVAQSSGRTVTWESTTWQDKYFTDAATAGAMIPAPTGVSSKQVSISLPQFDLLLFRLTVRNYGTTPIRTIGPWSGTVYQYDQTDAAMFKSGDRDAFDGVYRIGLECERSTTSYPYRWALGTPDTLTKVARDNETFYYLMPGQSTVVWGAVRMTTIIRTRNPQKCFAGLIHEGRLVFQGRTGEIDVKLETPLQPSQ